MAKNKKEELKTHSRLSASSAKRWINCPGSLALIDRCPKQEQSIYAEEGTLAHKFAEDALAEQFKLSTKPVFTAEERELFTEEMQSAVNLYRDTIVADMDLLGGELLVEEKFELDHLHKDLGGTNDCILAAGSMLVVYDFKYGKGVSVEVRNNEQLLIYALGAIKKLNRKPDTVELVIVQPRAYHADGPVRRQVIYASQLIDFASMLRKRAAMTDSASAKLAIGDWCTFCPAMAICPEKQKEVQETAMVAFDDSLPTLPMPGDIEKKRIVQILQQIPMLDDWINSIKAYALDMAKSGEKYPGFKLVRGKTNRKWTDENAAVTTLFPLLGDKIYTAPALMSPAKVEKLFEKDDRVVVESLCHNPEGALNLVPEDDPREAISFNPGSEFKDDLKKEA